MLLKARKFPCIFLFFGELKDQLLSIGRGGGGKGQRIFEDHMVYREGGGVQKGCIPGCGFWLNAYLRTSFRLCVSGMTPMSRFYYPNVVGKGQQVKMQRRGPVCPARNIIHTFCCHLLSFFYKGLLCRNAWLIFSCALF